MKNFVAESAPGEENLIALIPQQIQNELGEMAEEKNLPLEDFLKKAKAYEYDDIMEVVLHALPHELLKKRMGEYEAKNTSLYDAIVQGLDVTEKRKSMWSYEGKEEYEEETINTIKVFEGAKYHQELFKGKGNAAFVYEVPEVPGVCIKFLHNPSQQRYTPEREFQILGMVNEIAPKFKRLKIPQAHGIAKNIDATKSFFTMQTIDGITLQQAVEFPSVRKEMLKKMNMTEEDFISFLSDKNLHDDIAKDLGVLHDNRILHGDIHQRNIMIDVHKDIYLIDFGNAIIETSLPVGVDYETVENSKELNQNTLINSIKQTKSLLEEQLQNSIDK